MKTSDIGEPVPIGPGEYSLGRLLLVLAVVGVVLAAATTAAIYINSVLVSSQVSASPEAAEAQVRLPGLTHGFTHNPIDGILISPTIPEVPTAPGPETPMSSVLPFDDLDSLTVYSTSLPKTTGSVVQQ